MLLPLRMSREIAPGAGLGPTIGTLHSYHGAQSWRLGQSNDLAGFQSSKVAGRKPVPGAKRPSDNSSNKRAVGEEARSSASPAAHPGSLASAAFALAGVDYGGWLRISTGQESSIGCLAFSPLDDCHITVCLMSPTRGRRVGDTLPDTRGRIPGLSLPPPSRPRGEQ